MNSAATPAKKSALCRYFVNSGTCFYGSECQFLHEAPRPRRNQPMPNMPLDQGPVQEGGDGNNGDQFFTATFSAPPVAVNGTPDFQPFFARNKSLRNGPVMNPGDDPRKAAFMAAGSLSPALDDSALSDQFATMSMSAQGKFPHGVKGRNPGATVFVPQSSTPQSGGSVGLTHSASTPSFSSYSTMNNAGLTGNVTASPQNLAQVVLGDRSSPMASPGLSPTGSPLADRRNKSPMTPAAAAEHAAAVAETLQVENVGGTTYFYTQDDLETSGSSSGVVFPNFTVYPGMLPHVAHMKPKANMPSFFMPDELKVELLNKHTLTMAQLDPDLTEIPTEVDTYHNLVPIEPPPANPMHKSSTFGYQTSVYKAINTKDGMPYCLRRIHGFRLVNTKCMALIDLWKKIQHSNIVQLREVFTTKAFGDHSMVFVYDFHPGASTLMIHHFCPPPPQAMNGFSGRFNMDGGGARPYSASKGPHNRQQQANLLAESLIWSYVVQLSSALRTIHAHGLACRVMDPTKVLVTDKSRLRLNCLGIFDILSFDANQGNALTMMPHYQQEDLVSLGRVVLALACNSVSGIQREHIQASLELVARNYSADLKNLILYLLTNQNRVRSVNDIMPMIGARFYTQLDASQLRNDVLENEIGKEIENGRLFRLMCKLGTINDRPEFHMDPTWAETGDRYMLKLFRDYLFHQVDENGAPWIDMAHITQCLNKLDCGVPEKLCLMSRDEQSVLVVSYAELKQCFMTAFSEMVQSSHSSQQQQQAGYS